MTEELNLNELFVNFVKFNSRNKFLMLFIFYWYTFCDFVSEFLNLHILKQSNLYI